MSYRDRDVLVFTSLLADAHGKNAVAIAEQRRDEAGDNEYVVETWSRVITNLRAIEEERVDRD